MMFPTAKYSKAGSCNYGRYYMSEGFWNHEWESKELRKWMLGASVVQWAKLVHRALIAECWFEIRLLCLQTSSLLMGQGRQWKMVVVVGAA